MNQSVSKLSLSVLKLIPNRVNRSYRGGLLIEQWQGLKDAADSDKPEEWVASVVEAKNKNYIQNDGLSELFTADKQKVKLIDLIRMDSEAFLGKEHVAKYDDNPAVLTKILDAAVRLSIQVHPTKDYARKFFNSAYGKTEAWYILGGRNINNEPPYVLLGFKPGITRELWKKYFEAQDVEAMIQSLHKYYVKPGDVFLIEGGLPHAIGSGCFLIEVQEPTDYTMRVERTTFDGNILPDTLCHQGVGFERMLDCFNYEELSAEETLKKYFKNPRPYFKKNGNELIGLITEEDTNCFSMIKLHVVSNFILNDNTFKTFIVLQGSGELLHGNERVEIRQGDTYFLPASLGQLYITNNLVIPLEIILCYPPSITL